MVSARISRSGKPPPKRLVLENSRFKAADFSGEQVDYVAVANCTFEACKFERLRLKGFSFGAGRIASTYLDCSFDDSRFSPGAAGIARFERCSFRNVKIKSWNSISLEFVECTFSGRLQDCLFHGTVPEDDRSWVGRARNEFDRNDFSAAEFKDVFFETGIDLTRQRLPQGADYVLVTNGPEAVKAARTAVSSWSDAAVQSDAAIFVSALEGMVAGGQMQLFFRRDDYNFLDVRAVRGVVDVLLRADSAPL